MAGYLPGLQLAKIHEFLRSKLESFSSEEILKEIGIDIESSSEILLSLNGDESKVLREKDGKWRWASKYQLRNFSHLLSLIARSSDGINERDLYDSYHGIKKDIAKLKQRGAVYEIKSGSKTLLFPRDPRLELTISTEILNCYNQVSLPDSIEVHRYLVEKGLKQTDDATGVKIAQPVSRKRPSSRGGNKRKQKKIKLTNTHMLNSGIDLSKDYNPGKDSAFN